MPTEIEPPRPAPDALTQPFWDGCRQRKLLILRCSNCGHYIHFPRPVCRFCLSTDLVPEAVSGRATVVTYAVAVQPFHPYYADKVPYVIGTVELAEQPGLMMFTRFTGCTEDDMKIGMAVEVAFEDVADDLTLPLFRPAD